MPAVTTVESASAAVGWHWALAAEEIFREARAREQALSRLLMAFITTGTVFMVFPGTFLGVWNLIQISGRESVASISPAWLQAHGHAQVFGWVASFILGIGLYSIPKLRGESRDWFRAAWACWGMWTVGALLRWFANVYLWQWRILLPVSAALELGAFAIFFRGVSQHRPNRAGRRLDPWIWVVAGASMGFLAVLLVNFGGCIYVVLRSTSPAFPHLFDQRYLALAAWGFLVPFVWGFSAKWMPVFLGLRPIREKYLLVAVAINFAALAITLLNLGQAGSWMLAGGVALTIFALGIFEPSVREPKTRGIHRSFPVFVRLAYAWLIVAAVLNIAGYRWDVSGGMWGASRHALTVGFVAVTVFGVGQRILPAFAGMRLLWSAKLMFWALGLLTVGCSLRVSCEVLAYQGYADWAWSVLPASALIELCGITAFGVNLMATFVLQPSHVAQEPLVAKISGKIA